MSLFEAAQNVSVDRSTFHVAGRDQVIVDHSVHTHVHHHGPPVSEQTEQRLAEATVPNPSTLFQGRRAEIKKLMEYFAPRVIGEPCTRRSLLLYGMGGIGKTQLCRKFAEEAKEQFSYVFWVDASTPETFALSLKKLPGSKSAGSDGSAEAILQWISSLDREWLLILDNAEEHIHNLVPPGQNGNILISSRNRMVGRLTSFEAIEVEQLEEEDAVTLLLKASCLDPRSTSDALQSTARAIVRELHCLPLAVDQAGNSIGSGLCGMDDFLRLYSSCRKDLLDDSAFKNASPYAQTVYSTWELSYKKIESVSQGQGSSKSTFSPEAAQTAIAILQTFAYLHHDNIMKEIFRRASTNGAQESSSINRQLLVKQKDGEWDELHFNNGIRVLLSLSLIKQGQSNDSYSIHPLVHSWSRDRLSSSEQQAQWTGVMKLLSSSISRTFKAEDYHFRRHLVPHISANTSLCTFTSIKEVYNAVECLHFGLSFGESGNWTKAEELYSQALALNQRQYGDEHLDTLLSMGYLASTLYSQGRWSQAEELQVLVLDIYKRVLGDEHPGTLSSMANLASIFWSQGRWSQAEELQVQGLDISKRVLGDEHPDTLSSMADLASIFWNQGRWSQAEELEVQVLDLMKRVFGGEHPHTLTVMANLGTILQSQGKWFQAEELLVQVLDIHKRVLGDEHPGTLSSMANLASIFWSQGRWSQAKELEVQVLDICKRVLGDEHPHTLNAMANLATTLQSQGKWSQAEELLMQVSDLSKRVLGDEHPDTLISMGHLAATFQSQGRWSQAEELRVQVLDLSKRVLGDEHPDTLISMGHLASTFWYQGRWSQAEELHVQVLDIHKRVLGNEHPHTLTSMANLSCTYQSQKKWGKAEELITQAVSLSRQVLGEGHPYTQTRAQALAELRREREAAAEQAVETFARPSKRRRLQKNSSKKLSF